MILYCDAAGNPAGYGLPFNVIDECSGTVTSTIRYVNIAGATVGTSKPAAWTPCETCCPVRFSDILCYDDGVNAIRSVNVVTTITEAGVVTAAVYELDGTPIVPTPAASTLAVCSADGVADTAWYLSDGTTSTRVDPGETISITSDNSHLTATVAGNTLTLDYFLCDDINGLAAKGRVPEGATDFLLGTDENGDCVRFTAGGSNAGYVATDAGNPAGAPPDGVDTYINTTDGSRWEWRDTDSDDVGDTWVQVTSAGGANYVAMGTVNPTVAPADGADTYINTTTGTRWEWQDTNGDDVGDTWTQITTAGVTVSDTDCINLTLTGSDITADPILAPDDGAGCTTNGIECTATGLWVDPNPVSVIEKVTITGYEWSVELGNIPNTITPTHVSRYDHGGLVLGNADPDAFLSTTDASRLDTINLPGIPDGFYDGDEIYIAVITHGGGNGAGTVSLNTTAGPATDWKVLGTIQHPDYPVAQTVMWTTLTALGAVTVEAALGVWAYSAAIQFYCVTGVQMFDLGRNSWNAGYSQNTFAPNSAAATAGTQLPGPVLLCASAYDYDEADILGAGPFIREQGGTFTQWFADGYTLTQSVGPNLVSLVTMDDDGEYSFTDFENIAYKTEQGDGRALLSAIRLPRADWDWTEHFSPSATIPAVLNPLCNTTAHETIRLYGYNVEFNLAAGDAIWAVVYVDGVDYALGYMDNTLAAAPIRGAFPINITIDGADIAPGASTAAHTIEFSIYIESMNKGLNQNETRVTVSDIDATTTLTPV